MKKIEKSTLIPWAISTLVLLVSLIVIVLFATGSLALSDTGRIVLAFAVTVSMIVFAYMSCKYAGVLKGQKNNNFPAPQEKPLREGYLFSKRDIPP